MLFSARADIVNVTYNRRPAAVSTAVHANFHRGRKRASLGPDGVPGMLHMSRT